MSTLPGYSNAFPTPYGTANFWVLTDLHLSFSASGLSMSITLSGYPTATDANAGVTPIGMYGFTLSQQATMAMFSSSQPAVQNAIVASSPDWANVAFVPAT